MQKRNSGSQSGRSGGQSGKQGKNKKQQEQEEEEDMIEEDFEGEDEDGEEGEDEDEKAPKKILDRSQLMDHMLFPENGPTLVIVPSNKQGTGFLNHCYDEQYLKDHITEKEFNAVVTVASKLASKCYAKKKILDKRGVNPRMKLVLTVATLMAVASLWTIYESFNNVDNKLLAYVSHVLISVSLLSVFASLIVNWRTKVVAPITFNQMVKNDLDEFFGAVNLETRSKGIEWGTIDGHYWLELKITKKKEGEEQVVLRANVHNGIRSKLVRILNQNDIKVNENLLRQIQGLSPMASARGGKVAPVMLGGPKGGNQQDGKTAGGPPNKNLPTEQQSLVHED